MKKTEREVFQHADVGQRVIFTNAHGTYWCGVTGEVEMVDGGYYYIRPSRQSYSIECYPGEFIPVSSLPITVRYKGERQHTVINKVTDIKKGIPFSVILKKS